MSDFLDRVVTRALGRRPALEPRLSSRYAPPEHRLAGPEAATAPDDAAEPDAGSAEAERPWAGAAAEEPDAESTEGSLSTSGESTRGSFGAGSFGADSFGAGSFGADGAIDSLPSVARAATLAPAPLPGGDRPERTDAAEDPAHRALGTQASWGDRASIAAPESRERVSGAAGATAKAIAPRDRGGLDRGDRGDRDDLSPPLVPARAAAPPPPAAAAADSSRPATGQLEDAFWKFLYGSSDESSDGESAGVTPSFPGGPDGGPQTVARPAQPALGSAGRDGGAGRRNAAALTEASEAPEITIAIERIDVRGLAPAPQPPAAAPARRGPRLSLEEYMRQSGSVTAKR